jgi:hypothetical protein
VRPRRRNGDSGAAASFLTSHRQRAFGCRHAMDESIAR